MICVLVSLPLLGLIIRRVKYDFISPSFSEKRIIIGGASLLLYIIAWYVYDFSTLMVLLGLYAFASVFFMFESRISLMIAIILLAFCPIMILIGNSTQAQFFAVIAYYFMGIGALTYAGKSWFLSEKQE